MIDKETEIKDDGQDITVEKDQADEQANNSPYQRFKQASQVAYQNSPLFVVSSVAVFVVVLVVGILLSLSSAPSVQRSTPNGQLVEDNSNALKQNEASLLQWERSQGAFSQVTSAGLLSNKDMQSRMDAPTQLYAAVPGELSEQSQGQNPGPDINLGQNPPLNTDTNTDTDTDVTASATSATQNTATANTVLVGNNNFAQFANSQATVVPVVTGSQLTHPDYTLAEGELIHAVLETAIDSDLPGMVRAVVTQPVYSFEGEKVLVPAGSRLIGQYTSMASNGSASARVFVVWNRILTPNGVSMMINSPGTDALGMAGMGANNIDDHFGTIFGSASLLSVLGAGSANVGVSSNTQSNSANLYQQSIANGFQQAAQTSLGQNLSIQPTLHIDQGSAVTVFVANDVDLYSVLVSQTKSADNDGKSDNNNDNSNNWEFLS